MKDSQPTFFKDLNAFKILIVLISVGLLSTFIFCFHFLNTFLLSLSNSLIIICVSLIIGALIGFLFGIPKSLQGQSLSNFQEHNSKISDFQFNLYVANTNLEQISDWLTKILVGVGLTQITNIPELLKRTAEYVNFGFKFEPTGSVFICLLLIYYIICGFLYSYLWTRLYLVGAFHKAETIDTNLSHGIIAFAETFGNELDVNQRNAVSFLKREAEENLVKNISPSAETKNKLKNLAKKYEHIRETMLSSKRRTFEMNEIVSQMRTAVKLSPIDKRDILEMFDSGSDGYRIAAIVALHVYPTSALFEIVEQGISDSRSAFEQYQSLRAASLMLSDLDNHQCKKLIEIIEDQKSGGPDKYINKDTDRWELSLKIVEKAKSKIN